MFAAKFDKKARKWRGVGIPKDGVLHEKVLVLQYAPEAAPGAFVNPRAVFQRRETAIRALAV